MRIDRVRALVRPVGRLLEKADEDPSQGLGAIGRHELENASLGADKGLVIGRSKALCAKVIADGSVSRRHARIVAMGKGLGVEDLNSSFGVTVNGKRVDPYKAVPIPNGATVAFGDVKLTVKES